MSTIDEEVRAMIRVEKLLRRMSRARIMTMSDEARSILRHYPCRSAIEAEFRGKVRQVGHGRFVDVVRGCLQRAKTLAITIDEHGGVYRITHHGLGCWCAEFLEDAFDECLRDLEQVDDEGA